MSRVLLDTHLLLWWLKADPRLPASLVTELQMDRHSVLISQASLLEMAIKVNPRPAERGPVGAGARGSCTTLSVAADQ